MINWISVFVIPVGGMLGVQFGRRRREAAGDLSSFLPLWAHCLLTYFLGVATILFIEAARAALSDATACHLWMLIAAGVASQIVLILFAGGEVQYAKKRLAIGGGKAALDSD